MQVLDSSALSGCTSLETAQIDGDGSLRIGQTLFKDCSSLETVILGTGVGSIDDGYRYDYGMFYRCGRLKSVEIRTERLPKLPKFMFYGTPVEEVFIAGGCGEIGENVFAKCTSLQNVSGDFGSVTNIAGSAFSGCSSLASVPSLHNVEIVGSSAFSGCSSLAGSLDLSSAWTISSSAFSGCASLSSVTLSASLTRIDDAVFSGCASLSSMSFPASLTSIGGSAFKNCASLPSVSFGNSLTSIGGSAFQNCTSLKTFRTPASLQVLDSSALSGCTSLETAQIDGDGSLRIGQTLFKDCSSLETVILGTGVGSIDDGYRYDYGMFYRCGRLKSVEIRTERLPKLPKFMFYGTPVEEVFIAGGCGEIGERAFYQCTSLQNVSGDFGSVTNIAYGVFDRCSSLASVPSLHNVEIVGSSAFSGCPSLAGSLDLSSAWTIGSLAFSGCKTIEGGKLGENLTSIGNSAFSDCTNAFTFTFAGPPPNVGSSPFNKVKTGAIGTYTADHAAEWEAVIDDKGYWNGLKMRPSYYTIIYDANNETGETLSRNGEWGVAQLAEDGTFVWEYHYFIGWAFAPDGEIDYTGGDTLTEPTDGNSITLYAKWSKLTLLAESADWLSGTITFRCEDTDTSDTVHTYSLEYRNENGVWTAVNTEENVTVSKGLDTNGQDVWIATLNDEKFSSRLGGIPQVEYRVKDENGRISEPCVTRNRHGLFVAVDEYQRPSLKYLPSVKHEAAVFKDAYVKYGGVKGFCPMLNFQPTKFEVLSMLDVLAAKVLPGDVFLFYFVGHGSSGVIYCYDQDGVITSEDLSKHFGYFKNGVGLVSIIYSCFSESMFIHDNSSLNMGRIGWILSSRATEKTWSESITRIICQDGWFNGKADLLNGEYGRGNGDEYVTFWELAEYGFDWTEANDYHGHRQRMKPENTFVLGNIVAGKVPPNDKPSRIKTWLTNFISVFTASDGDAETAVTMTAANGCRTVGECYALGIDPEDPDDDLKITDFKMKDGKPVITLNHTKDGSGYSFEDRIKTLGKTNLYDKTWLEIPKDGTRATTPLRFFKVEVEMP